MKRVFCDGCGTEATHKYREAHIEVTWDNRGDENIDTHVDLCMPCYSRLLDAIDPKKWPRGSAPTQPPVVPQRRVVKWPTRPEMDKDGLDE